MGTSQEKHHDEAEKSVGRLLKDGNIGSLARAKETLKGRLYQQMIQEVQDSFENADEIAQLALDDDVDWNATLTAARSALKKHLVAQMVQKALEEACTELEDTERLVEEAIRDWSVNHDVLDRIKQTFKDRLMADMLEAAIAEIDDEVGSDGSPTEQEVELIAEAHQETIVLHQDEKVSFPSEELTPDEEQTEITVETIVVDGDPLENPVDEDVNSSLIDMHFWQGQDEMEYEGEAFSEPFDSVTEASEELAADPDFFPQEAMMELGGSFGDGSSAEPIPDGTPISILAGFSMSNVTLDDTGDGASHEVDVTDAEEETAFADEHTGVEAPTAEGEAYYVYGVFPKASVCNESQLPSAGIDPEFSLFVYSHEDLSAIVSTVDRDTFGSEALVENLKDEQWSEAANLMHDELVDDCRSIHGFLAMPFGSVFGTRDRVQHLLELAHNTNAVPRAIGCNEWTVRVYRNRDTLHQHIMERSETVQGIMAEIKSKPKGEAAAIKKRMVSTIQDEIAETTDHCTSEVHEQLLSYADEARLGTPDRTTAKDKGEGIFNATYLVHEDKEFDFHTDLEALCRDYEDLGFQIEVLGPMFPVLDLPMSLLTSN